MKPKNSFSWADFERLRRTPLATMGIFISPYCPVECGHCAVSASSHTKTIPPDLLIHCVGEMVQSPNLKAVAITGGEPFAELELLKTLSNLVHNAKKRLVIYTSGYWGKEDILERVEAVLRLADGLVLGVDLYHRAHIPDEDLINALRCAAKCGVWVSAQVMCGIEGDAHLAYARSIFGKAYGPDWKNRAILVKSPPMPSGRATNIAEFQKTRSAFGEHCYSINGPTLLRDGTLAACCNEDVVLHKGPKQFRMKYTGSFNQTLNDLENQPILSYLRKLPPTVLVSLASQCLKLKKGVPPARLCQACWDFVNLYARMNDDHRERLDLMVNVFLETQKSLKTRNHRKSSPDMAEGEQAHHV